MKEHFQWLWDLLDLSYDFMGFFATIVGFLLFQVLTYMLAEYA